jgi:hypothetical protein
MTSPTIALFQIEQTINVSNQILTIAEIGMPCLYPGKDPSRMFIPVKVHDGTYRIIYCSEEHVDEIVISNTPELTEMIHTSQAMPRVAYLPKKKQLLVEITDPNGNIRTITISQHHTYDVDSISSVAGEVE